MKLKAILLGTAACALFVAPALAQDAVTPPKHHHRDSVEERLNHMERLIEEQQAEIRELKGEHGVSRGATSGGATTAAAAPAQPEVTASQFEALQNQVYEMSAATKGQAVVKMAKGRPTISSADGKWTWNPYALVQGDWATYTPGHGKIPGVANDGFVKKSGENFRRAQIGFQGTLAGDFKYAFVYDFGGSNGDETYQAYFNGNDTKIASTGAGTGPHIQQAWVGYTGILDPITFKIGALPTPTNLADGTSSADLLFNERPSPAQIDRALAGDDGRDSVGFQGNGSWWFGSAYMTGDAAGKGDLIAPGSGQEAFVGRAAVAPFYDPDTNFNIHLGGNFTDIISPQKATSWNGTKNTTAESVTLSDRPELRVDNITFLNTGAITATSAQAYGLEGAASWGPLMAEGEYFWYDITRAPVAKSTLTNPNFSGWYGEASWVISGESRKYNMATASYTRPSPDSPVGSGGWGAWEVAGRYSSTDLEYHPGVKSLDPVYGGKQDVTSAGLNWYPIDNVKVMFDYETVMLTDIGGLTGFYNKKFNDFNGRLEDFSTRVQVTF
jgi:phosphate-selective porin OprO/OprP